MVMVAFGLVALVGVTGLAVDSGRGYLDRRALQGGADTASEAGTSMLAANFHQPAVLFTDAQVGAQVAAQVNNSTAGPSGLSAFMPTPTSFSGGTPTPACDTASSNPPQDLTATCAWYADTNGNLVLWPTAFAASGHAVQVGNGTMPPVCPPTSPPDPVWGSRCTAGVSVVAYFTHDTYFMRALGQLTAAERAVGTSTFDPILTTKDSGIAHYAIWSGCSIGDNTSVDVGDQVIIRSNQYDTNAGCGQISLGSNNFKGWFHNPVTSTPPTSNGCGAACAPPQTLTCSGITKTDYTELDYLCMSGGNANESADIAIIDASWDSCVTGSSSGPCKPMLIPVFDMLTGRGSNIQGHIRSWAAAVPDQRWDQNTPRSTDWTVHIVALVARRGDWNGCPTPPCPVPPPSTPVAITLVK
jgi:hypothetical protein